MSAGAMVARRQADGPIGIADLPPEQAFDFVSLSGGFAVIHEKGVLLFDDWRTEPLKIAELQDEFERTLHLLGEVRWVGNQLDGIMREKAAASQSTTVRPLMAVLSDLATLSTLRGRLARARHQYGPKSEREDVRRFRQRLEGWWGIEKAVDERYKRVSEIEDAFRTAGTLRTQGLVGVIATYGLPFFISSAITGFLSDWIEAGAEVIQWKRLGPAAQGRRLRRHRRHTDWGDKAAATPDAARSIRRQPEAPVVQKVPADSKSQ